MPHEESKSFRAGMFAPPGHDIYKQKLIVDHGNSELIQNLHMEGYMIV